VTLPSPTPPAGPLRGADAVTEYVQRRTQDGVAVLTMAGPDGNRLGPELIAALSRAVANAQRDDGVRALVLTARGPDFCAGPWMDLPPPGPEAPQIPAVIEALAKLCMAVETGVKPMVCALHGRVASGGLALALAAQACISDTRAMLHFPEPRLGRLPPGGGAVRLAWRLGAAPALRLLQARAPVAASDPANAPFIGRVLREGLLPGAVELASHLALHPNRGDGLYAGLADATGYRDAIMSARAAQPQALPLHRHHETALLDVVEAAQLLPPDQALAFDMVQAQEAALAPVARALAHLARATRRALDTPESRENTHETPRNSPLAAALDPAQAARLVPALLRDGVDITLMDQTRDPLAATLEAVAEAQMDLVRDGRMTAPESEQDWQRLSGRMSLDPAHPPAMGLAGPDHIAWLAQVLAAETGLAIWLPGGHPLPAVAQGRVVMAPAPARAPRLCEIIVQPGCPAVVVQQATRLAMRLKLTPLRAFQTAALPQLRDAAEAASARLRAAGVPDRMLSINGSTAGNDASPADTPFDLPLPPDRLILLAVINTGARLLRERISLRPSDLDLLMVLGAGWPNWRGGPMAEGDAIGPMVLRHELRLAAALDADLWQPDAVFEDLIRSGRRFEDLNKDPLTSL